MQNRLSFLKSKRFIVWSLFYSLLVGAIVTFIIFTNQNLITGIKTLNGTIALTTNHQRYDIGDKILFTLTNSTDSAITIDNRCPEEPLNVYYRSKGSWVKKHSTVTASICVLQSRQITIDPHSKITGSYKHWVKLFSKPGIYRIAAVINGYNQLVYKDIEILSAPKVVIKQITTPAPKPVVQKQESEDNEEHEEEEVEEHEIEDEDDD